MLHQIRGRLPPDTSRASLWGVAGQAPRVSVLASARWGLTITCRPSGSAVREDALGAVNNLGHRAQTSFGSGEELGWEELRRFWAVL